MNYYQSGESFFSYILSKGRQAFFCVAGVALALSGAASFSHAASSLTVNVKDGSTALAGMHVYVVEFSTDGVGANSQVGTTDANGAATFSSLTDNIDYHVFASSTGYFPTVKEQFFSPHHQRFFGNGTGTRDIFLGKDTSRGVALVKLTLSSGTPNGLTCDGIRLKGSDEEIALSLTKLDASGNGTAYLHNVAADDTESTYEAGSFDGGSGLHVGTRTTTSLPAGSEKTIKLDNFKSDYALAPQRTESETSQTVQSGEVAGSTAAPSGASATQFVGISFEGMIQSTDTTNPITVPWSGIELRVKDSNSNNYWGAGWSNSDDTGRFQFFNLQKGTTYYLWVRGNCDWRTGTCYKDFQSRALVQGTTDYVLGENPYDFVFKGEKIVKKIKLDRVPPGAGSLKIAVKDAKGRHIPGAGIMIEGDWTSWHQSIPFTDGIWVSSKNYYAPQGGNVNNCPTGQNQGSENGQCYWEWYIQSTATVNNLCQFASNPWYQGEYAQQRHGYWDQQKNQSIEVDASSRALTLVNTHSTTGYALVTGLQPGNYQIRAWSPFGGGEIHYNAGDDGEWTWDEWSKHKGCTAKSKDDLRLTIEGNGEFRVYDASGVYQSNISSVTLTFKSQGGAGVTFTGTLKFPEAADLRNDPITIILRKDCQGDQSPNCWQGGGFDVVDGSGESTYTYSINVSTGKYWMEIISGFWGLVRQGGGENQEQFQELKTYTRDMVFAKAGKVKGVVYKPDGTRLIPGQTQNGWLEANVNAHSESGWGWTNLNNQGEYTLGGLPAGKYEIEAQIHGDAADHGEANYALPDKRPQIEIKAGQTVDQDFKFINARVVLFKASTANIQGMNPHYSNVHCGGGICIEGGDFIEGLRLPQGTIFDAKGVRDLAIDEHEERRFRMNLNPSNSNGAYCEGGLRRPDNDPWCPVRIPDNTVYDIFLVKKGDIYGWECPPDSTNEQCARGGSYFYITPLASSSSVRISQTNTTKGAFTYTQSWDNKQVSVDAVVLDLTPSGTVGAGASVKGSVTGSRWLTEGDFAQFGGDFEKFMNYIPVIAVFDESKNFLGTGLVTPPPAELAPKGMQFDALVSSGNWLAFQALLNGFSSWNYEIKGLPKGKKVFVTIETPNYPSRTESVTLPAADGESVTLNFNLDQNKGAVITGVVKSSSNLALEGATVKITAQGYPERKSVTSSTGVYRFDGVPAGAFRIEASAGGYVPSAVEQAITVTQSSLAVVVPLDFSLNLEGLGKIHGKVYSARIPFAKYPAESKVRAFSKTFVDDTANAGKRPPLFTADVNPSSGVYTLSGLKAGDTYRIFIEAGGMLGVSSTAIAAVGVGTQVDFDVVMRSEADAFVRKEGAFYIFTVQTNPRDTKDVKAWIGFQNFASTAADTSCNGEAIGCEVTSDFKKTTDAEGGKIVFTLRQLASAYNSASSNYDLLVHVVTRSAGTLVRRLTFGKSAQLSVRKPVDNILSGEDGNNKIVLDQSGKDNDPTAVTFNPGAAVAISERAVPAVTLTKVASEAVTTSGLTTLGKVSSLKGTFMGSIYDVKMESMSFSGTPIGITVGYNKTAVNNDNKDTLKIIHYDPSTDSWESVPGTITPDSTTGSLSININPNNPAGGLWVQGAGYGALATNSRRPLSHSMASGSFAVAILASTTTTSASEYAQYNVPNPFDLKAKTVTLRSGGSASITGTYIVVALPGSGTANVKIRIYNLAGDLVREISDTATLGVYNYFHWDGENKDGTDVASGVYFAVVDAPGAPSKKPIKMVVVK